MADDDRNRRRLGDATKGRIADLASGWDSQSSEPPPAPAAVVDAARRKPKTQPPPPPGSAARAAIDASVARGKPVTAPPPTFFGQPITPSDPGRTKPSTTPPPTPPAARAKGSTIPPPRTKGSTTPPPSTSQLIPSAAASAIQAVQTRPPITTAPLVIESARRADPTRPDATEIDPLPPAPRATAQKTGDIVELDSDALEPADTDDGESSLTIPAYVGPQRTGPVPIGEFDHGTLLENDKLREMYAQSNAQRTQKRDAASALLQIAEPPPTIVKPPPIAVLLDETAHKIRAAPSDPTGLGTSRFERGDPTTDEHGESQVIGSAPGTRLRAGATLRRKRGIGGDTRYVFTVLFGVRRARAELVELEAAQATRKAERRRNLVTLGRTAVQTEVDHPALSKLSDPLAGVEDERAGHAAQVAAADQELARTRRDRDAKVKQHAADLAAIEAELDTLAKKREPLDRDVATINRRAAEVRNSLQKIDSAIASAEASKTSIKGQKLEPAAIAAELATLRADRKAVQRDEPGIAAELDALEPRIAAIEAAQNDARTRRTMLERAEAEDQHRVAELLEAIGAKRKVVDRAAGDAEALRDRYLFELGEALYVDRPRSLAAQLAPIDAIDVELGTFDRRAMELREILSNVDRAKLVRGLAMLFAIVAVIGGIVAYIVYLAL